MPIWEDIYDPNESEKKLMRENPEFSKTSIESAYLAQTVMTFLYLSPYQQHNNGDAFRHCLWSSIVAKRISPEWAIRWTTAHEEGLSSGDIRRKMDINNNAEGIKIVRESPTLKVSDLIYRCCQLIHQGRLRKVQKKILVATDSSGFNVPNIFLVISERANEVLDFIADYYKEKAEERDADENSALHRCIMDDYEYGFNILVSIMDVNSSGNSGLTPLMICSTCSHGYKYAGKLIAHGANADYQEENYGENALMKAAVYGNREMINVLLPASNKKIKSNNGFTAYDLAMNENNLEIAKLLI